MAAEGARASLTPPSFGGARERREGRKGKSKYTEKGNGEEEQSPSQSVSSLGLIKTSLSSEGVEEEGSCWIGEKSTLMSV